jgi:hypothetical protein
LPPQCRTRGSADLMVMRAIIGFLGTWSRCGKACRRKKGCASPTVECFDPNIALIRADLDALAAWRRLDGPRPPAERDRPARVLID